MTEEFDYYYITFVMPGGVLGNTTLKQCKPAVGAESNGFNLATATEYLMGQNKSFIIITGWTKITQARYEAWAIFIRDMPHKFDFLHVVKAAPSLSSIDGGKEKGPERVAPILNVIRPEEPKLD